MEKYLLEVLVTVGYSQLSHEITFMCSLNTNSVFVLDFRGRKLTGFIFLTFF